MEFTMQSGGLPVGSYRAEFIGVEPYRENIEKYGEGASLKWRVLEGQHAGSEVTRICSMKLTPKTALGKFAVAIKGGAIQTGERFTFTSYIGVQGSLLVEATDNGGSRVSVFLRDAQAQSVATPQPQAQPTQPAAQAQPTQQSVETF
jgi:hypothetical protein